MGKDKFSLVLRRSSPGGKMKQLARILTILTIFLSSQSVMGSGGTQKRIDDAKREKQELSKKAKADAAAEEERRKRAEKEEAKAQAELEIVKKDIANLEKEIK